MESITSVSLVAAYIAGMVALFAPCCISYLFPAYLGSIFRERKYVLFMTVVYSLGILTIMLPVVLGAKLLSNFFFQMHQETYIIGGAVMILVSFMALLGFKMPMPRLAMKQKEKPDVGSTYLLGIFSGITSSCCAPVLIGVLALSSFSPSLIGSVLVGVMYVLGMVSPLYLASVFIHKRNILKNPLLKKKLYVFKLGTKLYPIFVANLVAFIVFFLTGVFLMGMAVTGNVAMGEAEMAVMKSINQVALKITNLTDVFVGINGVFLIVVTVLLVKLFKQVKDSLSVTNSQPEEKDSCCH